MNKAIGQHIDRTTEAGRQLVSPWLVLGLVALFFAAPWGWEHKAHMVLHGLCAQTPSHTLRFGSHGLPFDSRMTGIYGGFAVTLGFLVARGRHRCARVPSIPTIVALGLLVVAMAVDGFNSLLVDLLEPHFYQPDNRLRLATGMATGITIACVMCFLFAVSLWRRPSISAPAVDLRDFPAMLAIQAPFYLLATSGISALALPIALLLMFAALAAVSGIVLTSIVLFSGRDGSFADFGELDRLASLSVLVALSVIGLLAGGRFTLEHLLHLQPLT
jgi:uncharacterized membrane protein